jgi:hypothetical protein
MEIHPKHGCTVIIVIIVALGLIANLIGNKTGTSTSGSHSTQSNYSASHTCENCGKSYDGPGYMHILDDCRIATGEFANLNNNCSYKCCQESWIRYNKANSY